MPYTTAGAMLLPKGSKKKIGPSRTTIFLLYDNTTALTPHPLSSFFSTVRPRDTRPQAARTSQVHVFELGPKKFEMNEFTK